MSARRVGWAILSALVVAGCGAEIDVVPVAGLLQCDGRPLPDVLVTFVPEADDGVARPVSRGTTDVTGRFELTAADGRPGAGVGRHRVVLEDLRPFRAPRNERPGMPPPPVSRLTSRYASAHETPLRREVSAATDALILEVPVDAIRMRP
jgi:hypothetical protein